MRATGIVRRIDDLGRVVVPKEIRRTLRINEGDPLEIFLTQDGGIIFKKYEPFEKTELELAAEVLSGLDIAIPDALQEAIAKQREES